MFSYIPSYTYPFGWVLNGYTGNEKLDVNPYCQRTYGEAGAAELDVSAYVAMTYDNTATIMPKAKKFCQIFLTQKNSFFFRTISNL
jgi:hypothetical protein